MSTLLAASKRAALALAALASLGCNKPVRPPPDDPLAAPAPEPLREPAVVPAGAPAAPPRGAEVVTLAVPGFADAVASIPPEGDGARPVIVSVHGYRGRADWHCSIARQFAGADAFVLCPEGVRAPAQASDHGRERYTYASARALSAEIEAGLDALAAAYPGRVDRRAPLLYGHSLGAVFAAALAPGKTPYSRLILAEGGFSGWSVAAAHALHERGMRVLFACGTPSCKSGVGTAEKVLARAQVPSRSVYVEGAGHHSFGPIVGAIGDEYAWLVDGDPRFSPPER